MVITQTKYPEPLNRTLVLRVQDKLTEFLGTAEHDIMEYRYVDTAYLCGHSCPTVADAYLMVPEGLQALYGTEPPQRGEIEVVIQDARDEGAVGVAAAVAQLLTGAAPETDFGGTGSHGWFSRHNLLSFSAGIDTVLTLRRKDDSKAIAISLSAGIHLFMPEIRELMPRAVGGAATLEESKRFGELWRARMKAFLLGLADNP